MVRAIFPGSFDPLTLGHYSVVKRALSFVDEVIIAIGVNESKRPFFDTEARKRIIEETFKNEPRVKVATYDCLTVDFAKQSKNIPVAVSDTRPADKRKHNLVCRIIQLKYKTENEIYQYRHIKMQ